MCGLVGTLLFIGTASNVDEQLLTRMRDTMTHRGPDGGRTWVSADRRIGLAHRRLSIIDPAPEAAQPMVGGDGMHHLVFNGEIYNHAALRKELGDSARVPWKTDHSDAEVLVEAMSRWGLDGLHRLRGMFAFALWDERRRKLWLVRDRMGIKPLYYSVHHGRLSFASEINALLADPEQPRAVDEEALFHYLSFLAAPAPSTLFAGIRKLPAGSLLEVDEDGTIQERRWYDPWEHVRPLPGIDLEEAAARVLDTLREAVAVHAVSDVPIGIFLSGGIDSSTNAALFSRSCAGGSAIVKSFSIGYTGDHGSYPSELPYAEIAARHAGTQHHSRLISQDELIAFLPRMIDLQGDPIADPVCVPVHFVAELARQHQVVVAQVGEGADELFCGYPSWLSSLRLQRLDRLPVPRWAKHLGVRALTAAGKGAGFPCEYLRRGAHALPVFWGGAEAFTQAHKQTLLGEGPRRRCAGLTSWDVLAPIHERFMEKAWETSDLNWMTTLDLALRLPELLLMRLDKMCMGVSLEGRLPFLDHRVVELALAIPTAIKVSGRIPKRVLRRAVRGVIPDVLIDRRKQGFGVPVQEWFGDRLGALARNELDRFADATGLLDGGAVRALLDRGRGPQGWYLLNLALWHKAYFGA